MTPEERKTIIDNIFKWIITIGLGLMTIFLVYSLMMWAINDHEAQYKERNECLELAKDKPLEELSIRCIILISEY